MKIDKQPVTEQEYWQTIESIGGFIWNMRHDYHHYRITDEEWKSISIDVEDGLAINQRLVSELVSNFNVVLEKNTSDPNLPEVPEGKIYYWDWYNKQKREWLQGEYDKHICSACALSTHDLDTFSYQIPCSVFNGSMYRLLRPYVCGMVDDGWTREKLMEEIRLKGGEEAVERFLKKEEELTPVLK